MSLMSDTPPTLFHGSYDLFPVGTLLTPRGDAYENDWKHCGFYQGLERFRPLNKPAHKNSVFACQEEDLDLCGGALDVIFRVTPVGLLHRFDMEWGTQISCALDDVLDEDQLDTLVKPLAYKYWSGTPSTDPVWEFLAPAFRIEEIVENNLDVAA